MKRERKEGGGRRKMRKEGVKRRRGEDKRGGEGEGREGEEGREWFQESLSQVDKFEILVSQLQAYCLNPSSPGFIH
jgi:uncharacterized sporulation protein YeaH/YhbH (DUF444 family)